MTQKEDRVFNSGRMLQALRTQIHVIAALTIRGMQNARRNFAYGYAWTFVQPIAIIAFFRVGQNLTGLKPAGMNGLTFLILGVMGVFMFLHTITLGLKSPKRGLSVIPRITPLDMFVAQGVLVFITYDLLFWLFAIPSGIYEGYWPPENALGIQTVLLANWICGLALAYVFTALSRFFPPIVEFKRFISRPLRIISGMFFVIASFPTWTWPYLTWNPLLHVSELLRSYWFTTYTTPVGSLPFIGIWILGLTLLGLSLDRYVRRMLYE